MIKIVRLLLSVGFIAWVVNQYFDWHPYYTQAIKGNTRGLFFQLFAIIAILVIGWSFYRLLYHESAVVKATPRPVTLLLGWMVFVGLAVSLLFANSLFASPSGVQGLLGVAMPQFGYFSALGSFLGLFVPTILFVLVVVLLAAGTGYRALVLAKFVPAERLARMVISVAVGLCVLMFLLGILALLHVYTSLVVMLLALVLALIVWSSWSQVLKDFLWERLTVEFAYNRLSWVWASFLLIIITWNAIDIVRAFPIGWDDLGVYMNFPRQIAGTGSLIKGFTGQAYMMITSLGYLFTEASRFGMYLSWLGGVLAIWALYLFGKRFVDSEAGILMAALMYALPMVMHQSFADMKTDMALFFFIIVGVYAVFEALQQRADRHSFYRWLVVAGVTLSTALAIKVTTILALFAVVVLLVWRLASGYWAIVAFGLIHAIYWSQFVITPDFALGTKQVIAIGSLVVALAAGIRAWRLKQSVRGGLQGLAVLFAALAVIWIPWGISVVQAMPVLSVRSFVATALSGGVSEAPQIDWKKIAVNPSACVVSGAEEELGRYIGDDINPLTKYFGLPWDMTMNINQPGFYVDISFLFLSFIPLLILFWKREQWPELWQEVAVFFGIVWYFWLFVSSGIPWYGIAGFLPALLLVMRFRSLAQVHLPGARWWVPLLIILSLTSTTLLRETELGSVGQMAYSFGLKNEQQIIAGTNASYPAIIDVLNQEPFASSKDRYIYRIGTFINYFIDNNRQRVFDDAQLDTFRCLDGDASSDARTVERLQQLGFAYIVYDTNTQTIERDKNGTLHKKVSRFTQFALKNLKVVAPTDPSQYSAGIILFEIPR